MNKGDHHSDDPRSDDVQNSGGSNTVTPASASEPSQADPATAHHAMESTGTPDVARSIGGWMIAMLWIIAVGGATLIAQNWLDKRAQARDGIWVEGNHSQQALLVKSNRYGQYQVKGSANGMEVRFLLDTGASGISIPASVAEKIGLRRGRPFEVITANGVTTVFATELETLRIGPHARRNVKAHINPSMDGDVALLGMSFLRHYELLQRAGELTITRPD